MKNILYDVQTGETTFEEVPDIEIPVVSHIPTAEERLDAVEAVIMDVLETIMTL